MRRAFAQTKGTDWVDGFFWGIVVLFAGLSAYLWAKDFLVQSQGLKNPKNKND